MAKPLKSTTLQGRVLLDRYKLVKKLGSGVGGAVYRAIDQVKNTVVAVKVLHPVLLDNTELVQRFKREASAMAAINHPNVCWTSDVEVDDGLLFLVMEYLEGVTMGQRIESVGAVSVLEAVRMIDEIAAALERVHELGIVHRDIKPDNIFLVATNNSPELHIKILDFGLARVRLGDDATVLTQPGIVAGTPLYFSPEMCSGDEVDTRSDLYSVGVIFYQLLAGKPPFPSSDIRTVLNQHVSELPLPLSVVANQPIPKKIAATVMRLLEKRPADRFQNASQLRQALKAANVLPLDLASSVAPAVELGAPPIDEPTVDGPALQLAVEAAISGEEDAVDDGTIDADGTAESPVDTASTEDVPEVHEPKRRSLLSLPRLTPLKREGSDDSWMAQNRFWLMGGGIMLVVIIVLLTTNNSSPPADETPPEDVAANEEDAEDSKFGPLIQRFASEGATADREQLTRSMSPSLASLMADAATAGPIGEGLESRERIKDLLDDTQMFEQLDRWQQIAVELRLRDGKSCEKRQTLIRELRDLKDKRALPVLESLLADNSKQAQCFHGTLRRTIQSIQKSE